MQNVIRKTLIAAIILTTLFAAVYSGAWSAGAVQRVNGEPIDIMNTREILDADKIGTKRIIIEKCLGIVTTKDGKGHVVGWRDLEMDYSRIRYKGKRLKPGTKVLSYFPCNPLDDLEPLARFDMIKIKNKYGKKEWTLVHAMD